MKNLLTLLFVFSFFNMQATNDGSTCKNAIPVNVTNGYESEQTMQNGEFKLYYKFTASEENLALILSEGISSPMTEIYVAKLFEFNGCGNLNLLYNYVVTESVYGNNFEFLNLTIDQEYLLLIKRNPNKPKPLSYFNIKLKSKSAISFISPCPTAHPNCSGMIWNGNFSYATNSQS